MFVIVHVFDVKGRTTVCQKRDLVLPVDGGYVGKRQKKVESRGTHCGGREGVVCRA